MGTKKSSQLQEREMKETLRLYLAAGVSTSLMVILVLMIPVRAQEKASAVGAFEGHGDVGKVLHAGSVEYDAEKKSYTIAGSGENMWLGADAFHFVWNKIVPDAKRGDIALSADISFAATGGNPH